MDCSPQDSSVLGIAQARKLECVAVSTSGDLPNPGTEPVCPTLTGMFFTTETPRKPKFNPYSYKDYLPSLILLGKRGNEHVTI